MFGNIDHNITKLEYKIASVERRLEEVKGDEVMIARFAALRCYL